MYRKGWCFPRVQPALVSVLLVRLTSVDAKLAGLIVANPSGSDHFRLESFGSCQFLHSFHKVVGLFTL